MKLKINLLSSYRFCLVKYSFYLFLELFMKTGVEHTFILMETFSRSFTCICKRSVSFRLATRPYFSFKFLLFSCWIHTYSIYYPKSVKNFESVEYIENQK